MKKIFALILLLAIPAAFLMAQEETVEASAELMQLWSASQKIEGRDRASLEQLVDIHEKILWEFYQHSEKFREWNRQIENGTLYNLACYQALAGMTQQALVSFGQAVDRGYTNYRHILNDSDLDPIRDELGFIKIMEQIRENNDYVHILKQSGPYDNTLSDTLPVFTYQSPDSEELVRVREYFRLDTVAGSGDEISRIKNLMTWTHNLIRHDGSSQNPSSRNAIDMYKVCVEEERGVNCRMLAQFLNECYLAMGFKSRFVTCLPKKHDDPDCHVINAVWSETLDKWIWMDPSFNAWVMDEKGNLLGIQEVRYRLVNDLPLTLNAEANWNNINPQTKEWYIDSYMSKNLYYLVCPVPSRYNTETYVEGRSMPDYVDLLPEGYTGMYKGHFTTHNPEYFWQKPQ